MREREGEEKGRRKERREKRKGHPGWAQTQRAREGVPPRTTDPVTIVHEMTKEPLQRFALPERRCN